MNAIKRIFKPLMCIALLMSFLPLVPNSIAAADSNFAPIADIPATGDQSNLWLWIALMVIGCIALVTFIPLAGKKSKSKSKNNNTDTDQSEE